MTDDSVLAGFDPFDVLDREAVRLDAFFSTLRNNEWETPSRCAGWTTRDVLAHLTASEEYFHACLDGTVTAYLQKMAARGGTDLDSMNELGIREFDGIDPHEILDIWRSSNLETRRGFHERDPGVVDTSGGDYPVRWQAFHIAGELATHADDVHVPIADDEDELRWAWRVAYSRFALTEAKPQVTIEPIGERRLWVRSPDVSVDVSEHDLMEGVMGRLDTSSGLSDEERLLLKFF